MNSNIIKVGTYTDGRDLTYETESTQFFIGEVPVTLEQVLQYDAFSQINWISHEMRAWAQALPKALPKATAAGNAPKPVLTRKGRLLGFRSGRIWKMVIASVYYAIWILLTVSSFLAGPAYSYEPRDIVVSSLQSLLFSLSLISPALLLSDFNYRKRLPLFKHRKAALSVVGLGIVSVILIGGFSLVDLMYSDTYKAAEAEVLLLAGKERAQAKAQALAEKQAEARAQAEAEAEAEAEFDLGDMTDSTAIENFLLACEAIGIDPSDIRRMSQLSNWVNGERYSFTYESTELKVYMNLDGTVNSINVGETHVFEEGFEPYQIDDYLIDLSTTTSLQVAAENDVARFLAYPNEADFDWWANWGVGHNRDVYFVNGCVEAKNAFGVQDDLLFYVEYTKRGESYSAVYLWLDGVDCIGSGSVITKPERQELQQDTGQDIVLLDGALGEYGRLMTLDEFEYIWYDIPAGTYAVTSNVNWCWVFLDENDIFRNDDGYSDCINVQSLEFNEYNQQKTLTISAGQHVELTWGAKVTLTPID